MRRAILTGFEPFGHYKFNPTQDAAAEYNGKRFDDLEIVGLVLPCSYHGAFDALSMEIDRLSPQIVLSTGLASRVPRIRLELYGRNLMNGKYPDADGNKPENEPIVRGGKPWYRVNSDPASLANSMHEAGIPSELSVDAEGFICNSLIYLTARRIHEERLPVSHAFFHIPWTDDYLDRIELENGKATIRKTDLRKAIEISLKNM